MKKTSQKIYIAFAALLLVVPMALMPFFYQKNESDIVEMDKRYATSLKDVYNSAEKPVAFERWFSDHLAFRKTVISAFSHLNVAIGVSNNPEYVVIGREGWMFLGNVHAGKINQYRRIANYSKKQIDADIERIDALETYLASQEIAFIFAVPPNKENIYPEYLPAWMTVDGLPKYAEDFKTAGGEDLIYELYPDIMSAKTEYGDILYPKTDAHWTALGAYFGYESIVKKLNATYGTDYQPLSFISYSVKPNDGYELTKALGYAGSYDDFEIEVLFSPKSDAALTYLTDNTTWQGLHYYKNENASNNARVLLIGDSFSGGLNSYFENTFSDYFFIHFSQIFGEDDAAKALDQVILQTHPDVIILEIIERHLPSSLGLMPKTYGAAE